MRRKQGMAFGLPSLRGGGGGEARPQASRVAAGVEPPPPAPPRGEGRKWAVLAATLATILAAPLAAREVVEASAPVDLSVTIYRDPDRSPDERLTRAAPGGLALISETRRVTLPPGEATVRFDGVAEGMIGVSAIVTGLPGGTIEKNRSAALLSPAALVDGTLGNRVTVTRTNPATGAVVSESAIVRTRADGGLVLQTAAGFEALRCAGLPERLGFAGVPAGLSAHPVFAVDTVSPAGGTFEVTLTYLAWGFDWQADYVASLSEKAAGEEFDLGLLSWLTLVNDNGQSFPAARLQIVAGRLNLESDYAALARPPVGAPLSLTCYPLGSTAAGLPLPEDAPVPPPPPAPMMAAPGMMADAVVVTGARLQSREMASAVVTASEEDLGDLKLFRVPGRVDVAAKGMKQVAFLDRQGVKARLLYQARCAPEMLLPEPAGAGPPDDAEPPFQPAGMLLVTRNEEQKGLGIALPQGQMALFEPGPRGPALAARARLRDYGRGQEIELELGESAQVFARCGVLEVGAARGWRRMEARLANANPHPVRLRLELSRAGDGDVRFAGRKVAIRNGWQTVELVLPAGSEARYAWQIRRR